MARALVKKISSTNEEPCANCGHIRLHHGNGSKAHNFHRDCQIAECEYTKFYAPTVEPVQHIQQPKPLDRPEPKLFDLSEIS